MIVMIEAKSIRDVNNQQFTHASFWVQIHNVPLMCMHKGAIQKLGEKIRDVEEIETDDDWGMHQAICLIKNFGKCYIAP